jgi:hypothetical protein
VAAALLWGVWHGVAPVWHSERVSERLSQTSTPHRTLPRIARTALAAVLLTAVAGCLKVEMDLSIEGETVSGRVIGAIDRTAAETFGMDADDVFSQPEEEDFSSLDGVTTTPYQDDDWVGVEYVFDRVDLAELNELAGDDEEFPRIEYDADAGTYEFTLTMNFSDFDPDDATGGEGIPGFDLSALLERFDVMVSVTFPGEVTEHNGELSGTTVTWTPEPGERNDLRAVARATAPAGDDPASGGGDGPDVGAGLPGSGSDGGSTSTLVALLVALGVLLVAVGGGLGLWLVLRNRRPADSTVPADGSPTGNAAQD